MHFFFSFISFNKLESVVLILQRKGRLSNIDDISITLIVLKDDKFIFFNDEHSLNIYDIFATLIVLKDDKFISFNDEHSLNIYDISFTLLVLKDDKFISFNDEHSLINLFFLMINIH